MLSNLASAVDRTDVLRLAEAGIPVLEGTSTGLAAFRHLFAYRDARARPPVAAAPDHAPPPPAVRAVDQPQRRALGAERARYAIGEGREHVVELDLARDHRAEVGQQLEPLLVLAHE